MDRDAANKVMIKVLRANLPPIAAALPYLQRIEDAQWGSNFGPNVKELEQRLSDHYSGAYVVTCANATVGLEMAYALHTMRGRRAIEIPALTFPATWMAALKAGLEIIPIDVDPDTWVGPGVSGFGVPTYAPVVDAAPAWGEQAVPLIRAGMSAVFSGHSTKTLPMGEGGWFVTWDVREAEEFRSMSNFHIDGGKSTGYGLNGKMSEYHAAIGLASLDRWSREPWLCLARWYESHSLSDVTKQKRPEGVYPQFPIVTPYPAQAVMKALADRGIETRQWYVPSLDQHPLFEGMWNRAMRRHKITLTETHRLCQHMLCLPYHLHLTERDVDRIWEQLEAVMELGRTGDLEQ